MANILAILAVFNQEGVFEISDCCFQTPPGFLKSEAFENATAVYYWVNKHCEPSSSEYHNVSSTFKSSLLWVRLAILRWHLTMCLHGIEFSLKLVCIVFIFSSIYILEANFTIRKTGFLRIKQCGIFSTDFCLYIILSSRYFSFSFIIFV